MPVDCPIYMCRVSSPAVRPNLNDIGKECRTYLCKSCWMGLVGASRSIGIFRCLSCRQLSSSSSSYRNATEFVDQAAVAQSRRQSDCAKIHEAQRIVITAARTFSNCVLRLVRNRFLILALMPTTVLLRLPLSYREIEALDRVVECGHGARDSTAGKVAPTESASNASGTAIKPRMGERR